MQRSWRTRLLGAGLAVLLGVGTLLPAAADGASAFRDTERHWAESTIEWAVAKGIVDGYEDGTFKPEQVVSEPEFLAMLVRAYPELGQVKIVEGRLWYEGFYEKALQLEWEVQFDMANVLFNRGHVARLLASTQGVEADVTEAVRYLLDRKLADGKASATVDGFKAGDRLTRAEAVQFLKNAVDRGLKVNGSGSGTEELKQGSVLQVQGIGIGSAKADVLAKLGQPARVDVSLYGFDWYVYNKDLTNYTQVGIQGDRVVGLYTIGDQWGMPQAPGIRPGDTRSDVTAALSSPLTYILKGNTRFLINEDQEQGVYLEDGAYVTFYYDIQDGSLIAGIQAIASEVEEGLQSFYAKPSDRLRESFENESFDLANAERVKRGLAPFAKDDAVAVVSRAHSEDMAEQDYFDHTNTRGMGPADRAEAQGLRYRLYGENIAAGQTDAIHAHHGWMNSPGHRKNILNEAERLGVGVFFGGDMSVYYTQNFYTPR